MERENRVLQTLEKKEKHRDLENRKRRERRRKKQMERSPEDIAEKKRNSRRALAKWRECLDDVNCEVFKWANCDPEAVENEGNPVWCMCLAPLNLSSFVHLPAPRRTHGWQMDFIPTVIST